MPKLKYKFLLFTILLITILSVFYNFTYKIQREDALYNNIPAVVIELYNLLDKQKNISEDNTNNKLLQFNNNILKQADKIISNLNFTTKEKIKNYYTNPNLNSKELIKLLNILELLAINYNYQEFNGLKARDLMEFAKNIAEKYIINRSSYKFDFKDLNYDEIIAELNVIEYLPQIYTKIIYVLARTYILQGDKNIGFELFKISEHLGYSLNLFEGPMSSFNKAIIITRLAEIDINNNEFNKGSAYILDNIATYKKANNDERHYIINFHPEKEIKFIVPKNNLFNCILSSDFIIRSYIQLIRTVDNRKLQQQYLTEISKQLNTLKKYGPFEQSFSEIARRQIANVYNALGNCLLYANINNLDTCELLNIVSVEFKFYSIDDLKVSWLLYNKALSISRYNDYSKADAYDGLINLLLTKLKNSILSQEEQDINLALIKDYTIKRDEINKSLNRNIKQNGSR